MKNETHNVYSLFARAAETRPDMLALILESPARSTHVSFAMLRERSNKVAAGLRALGLQPGDRALIMIPMSIDLYVVLLALFQLGAVAVFIDPWISMRQIAAFSAFAKARAFIGLAKSHLLRLCNRSLWSMPITVTTSPRLICIPAKTTLRELESMAGRESIEAVEPDAPALITFTTGSSGTPKGANRTHAFLTAQHQALQQEFPYQDTDIDLSMFPVFTLNNLARGITTVIPSLDFSRVRDIDDRKLAETIRRNRVSTITASPPLIDAVARQAPHQKGPFNLRRILVGGAVISDAQLQQWCNTMPETELEIVYGSTEAEPTAHIKAQERLATKPTGSQRGICMGKITPQAQAAIVPIRRGECFPPKLTLDAIALPSGQIGELIVCGKHICRDYYNNPDAVRENKIVFTDGSIWHRMGDTGYIDTEGYFWLCGRVHSTIIRKGSFLHAQEIEQLLRQSDSRIDRIAAVAVPDSDLGERCYLVIQTSADSTALTALEQKVRQRASECGIPIDGLWLRSRPLPVDPRHNSKVQYPLLLEEVLQHERS